MNSIHYWNPYNTRSINVLTLFVGSHTHSLPAPRHSHRQSRDGLSHRAVTGVSGGSEGGGVRECSKGEGSGGKREKES